MSDPVKFLNALAQALATMGLYDAGHPARARVGDAAYAQLRELQESDTRPHFSFLTDSVVYGQRALHEMRQWPWATRLADAGVQRVEFATDVSREDFDSFLNDLLTLLKLPGADASLHHSDWSGVRYGAIGVHEASELPGPEDAAHEELPAAPLELGPELEVARWLYEASAASETVPIAEADGLVGALGAAMHADGAMLLPLLRLKAYDQYTAMHSINVSVLVMAFAEVLGFRRSDIHAFGMAGLLHDIGLAKIPAELLDRAALSREEQALVEQHPVEGARLLLRGDSDATVAAAAAFEHHVRADGGGYPRSATSRPLHFASRVVQVCAVYDALRNARPFRPAWPAAEAVGYIERGAGTEFDADVAAKFVAMMRQVQADARVVVINSVTAATL